MKVRAAIAAAVLAVALMIPANAFAYLTWFEFTRQSNIASTLTMAWQYGPGYYGTQTWRILERWITAATMRSLPSRRTSLPANLPWNTPRWF